LSLLEPPESPSAADDDAAPGVSAGFFPFAAATAAAAGSVTGSNGKGGIKKKYVPNYVPPTNK
jgi:hypothetical protein